MYLIDNGIAVNDNLQHVLFTEGDITICAASKEGEPETLIVYGLTNRDPCYYAESEFGEIYEDAYGLYDTYDLGFDFYENILPALKAHAENLKKYEDTPSKFGEFKNVEFYHRLMQKEITIDIKLTQNPYLSASPYNAKNYETNEYVASAIAENGEDCIVYWYIPADMEDVSDFDWTNIYQVKFID